MAEEKDIYRFDVDSSQAIKDTQALQANITRLNKTLDQYQKEGKDTTQIQKQLAAETAKLNKQFNDSQKTTENSTKALTKQAASAAVLGRRVNSLGSAIVAGSGFIANFAGGLGISTLALGALTSALGPAVESIINYVTGANEAASETDNLYSAAKDLIPAIVEEKSSLDALVKTATDETKSKAERKAAFDELQKQYPTYFGSLSLEASSLDKIKNAQKQATNALIENIVIKAQQAKINDIVVKGAERQLALTQELDEANRASAKSAADVSIAINQAGADAEARDRILAAQQEQSTKAQANAEADIRERQKQAAAETQAELAAITRQYAGVAKALQGVFEGQDLSAGASTQAGQAATKAASDVQKQADAYKILDGSLADLEKQLSEINKLINEQTKIGDQKRLATLAEQYKAVKAQVEAARKEINDLLATPIEFEPPSAQTLNELRAFQQQFNEQTLEDELATLRQRLAIEIEQVEAQAAREKQILSTKYSEDLKLASDNIEQQKSLQDNYQKARETIDTETTRKVLANRIRLLDIDRQLAEQAGDSLKVAELTKQIEELNLQLTELDAKSVTVKVNTKDAEKQTDSLKDKLLRTISGVEQLQSQFFSFLQAGQQQTTQALTDQVNRQRSAVDSLLNDQAQASTRQVELERQRLEALQAERRRSAEAEAVIIQAQIAANAALAIAKAAVEGGPAAPFTIATTLAALVFGFIEARRAAAQAFFTGTLNVQDPNAPNGIDTVPAWLTKGEAVMPVRQNKAYNQAMAAIYHEAVPAKILNDFVQNWQDYALMTSPQISQKDLLLIAPKQPNNKALIKEIRALRRDLARQNKEINLTVKPQVNIQRDKFS